MKKLLRLTFLVLILLSCSNDDETNGNSYPEKIFEGSVNLNTQIEVDEFGAENYTKITGSLHIQGEFNSQKITDLSPLQSLKFVGSRLFIGYNSDLQNLNGLNSLETIGEKMYIIGNSSLNNLSGLSNLSQIGDEVHISSNYSLLNLQGLSSFSSLTTLYVTNNENLVTLNGIENLSNIDNWLKIYENANLENFCALQNVLTNSTNEFIVVQIYDNLFNPNKDDILDGNCSQ